MRQVADRLAETRPRATEQGQVFGQVLNAVGVHNVRAFRVRAETCLGVSLYEFNPRREIFKTEKVAAIVNAEKRGRVAVFVYLIFNGGNRRGGRRKR